ncbi:MAG: M20/M25/M40 family metallo-hydrolase [Sporolactobacillus sp.]
MQGIVNEKRLVGELIELLKVDSPTGHEQVLASLLERKLAALDVRVQRCPSGMGSDNLVCQLPGTTAGKTLLFSAHMDTVAAAVHVQPRFSCGRFSSAGTMSARGSDDKTGIAALLEALRVVRECGLPHAGLRIVLTAGEESGLIGAKALDRELILADYGFVLDGEGKVGGIIAETPYRRRLIVDVCVSERFRQKRAQKASAMAVATAAVAHMPLGHITATTAAEIVRFERVSADGVDHVKITVEICTADTFGLHQQSERIIAAFQQAASQAGGIARVDVVEHYAGYHFSANAPVVRRACAAVKAIQCQPELLTSQWGSDANIFSALGVPTVALSVGFERIHTPEEYLPMGELVRTVKLVLALIAGACALKDSWQTRYS